MAQLMRKICDAKYVRKYYVAQNSCALRTPLGAVELRFLRVVFGITIESTMFHSSLVVSQASHSKSALNLVGRGQFCFLLLFNVAVNL